MGTALLLASATAAGYAAFYLLLCTVFPYRACRACKGAGKHKSPFSRAYRLCRACNATGLRVRIGRRLWTWYRAEQRNGRL